MTERTVTLTLRRKRVIYERQHVTVQFTDEEARQGHRLPADAVLDRDEIEQFAIEQAEQQDDDRWEEESTNTEALDPSGIEISPPLPDDPEETGP